MSKMTLGVDLSDAVVRVVVVDDTGHTLSRAELAQSSGHLAAGVRDAARRAIAAAGGAVSATAVAMTLASDDVPGDIAAALAEVSRDAPVPQAVGAGTASAIAEQWCGAARGLKQVITFAVGEHVIAGTLINGAPWLGAHGLAGAVGWLAMNPVEREDYRRYGGLESEIAAAGIVKRLVWRIKSGDRSSVADHLGGDLSRLTADDVITGARNGDGVSISVIRDTAKYVGMAVANLTTILDPEAIVLGGMLASSGDLMLEPIRVECSRRLQPAQADRVRVVLSTLGSDAVAIGAARAASLPRA
ncbi:MAG: ROK family protein [Acidobacteriota bacterium]|nr:ROK family protein [Acidobacteriota bacterium]